MDLGLTGKRAIITGASRGIGEATARTLAAEGVHVGLIARDEARLSAVAESIGGGAVYATADLAVGDQLAAAFDRCIGALGGVDILVNNAGESKTGSIEAVTDDDWQATIDLKLMGYVRGMRQVIPHMRAQRYGRIVNVGGTAGTRATAGYVLASIIPALMHITRSTAELVGPDGITVTMLHPGPTMTDRLREVASKGAEARGMTVDEFAEKVLAQAVPLRRTGTAVEMAQMIAIMCSVPAAWITGGGLTVDGGAAMGVVGG